MKTRIFTVLPQMLASVCEIGLLIAMALLAGGCTTVRPPQLVDGPTNQIFLMKSAWHTAIGIQENGSIVERGCGQPAYMMKNGLDRQMRGVVVALRSLLFIPTDCALKKVVYQDCGPSELARRSHMKCTPILVSREKRAALQSAFESSMNTGKWLRTLYDADVIGCKRVTNITTFVTIDRRYNLLFANCQTWTTDQLLALGATVKRNHLLPQIGKMTVCPQELRSNLPLKTANLSESGAAWNDCQQTEAHHARAKRDYVARSPSDPRSLLHGSGH